MYICTYIYIYIFKYVDVHVITNVYGFVLQGLYSLSLCALSLVCERYKGEASSGSLTQVSSRRKTSLFDDACTAETLVISKWRVLHVFNLKCCILLCTLYFDFTRKPSKRQQLQKPLRRRCQAFAPPGQDQLQMAMDPTAPRVKVRATLERRCAGDDWW